MRRSTPTPEKSSFTAPADIAPREVLHVVVIALSLAIAAAVIVCCHFGSL